MPNSNEIILPQNEVISTKNSGTTLLKEKLLLLFRLKTSKFARDALSLFVLNLASKIILFFGNAYAVKCLGPTKFGISALVIATMQQVALCYNGGFDTVGVRDIAAKHENARPFVTTTIQFRFRLAFIASIGWTILTFLNRSKPEQFPWFLGAGLLLINSFNIAFAFQGLEKLPIQTAIGAGGSLLTAAAFFIFFKPGIFLGSDLLVTLVINAITIIVSLLIFFHLCPPHPLKNPKMNLVDIIYESWRFWFLAVVVYFYSVFQIPLIAHFLGDREAGIYRSAFVMAAGLELLFNSINSLLLPRLVKWKEMGLRILWSKQSKLFFIFLLIGLVPIISLIFGSKTIYTHLLGDSFIEGILPFKILLVGRLVVFIGQIYAWGLAAIKQDNQFLLASIAGGLFCVVFSVLFIPLYGITCAAIITVLSEVVVHSICYLFQRSYIYKTT